jgi:acyl-CoA dehydrogenase
MTSAGLAERGVPPAAPARPLPPFDEQHERRRLELRAFVERDLRPRVGEWERERWFPSELFAELAERGLLGLKYPSELGGEGGDHLDDAIFVEELARCGSGGLAAAIGAHTGIATPPIWEFGTPEQQERFLRPAIRGERIAALGITEPDAGSDVAGIRTRAEPVDGGWVVSGAKTYITNGVRADYVVTAVKTTGEGGHRGLSFLIVERGSEGFAVSRKLEKLGWHASDTGELSFTDVFVPEENLLGEENRGFYLIMANFQWERLLMALGAVGGMSAALERTLRLAPARPGQAFRHAAAEMALKLETGRALTYAALRRFHAGEDAVREVTMAKLVTQRGLFEVAERALRLVAERGLYTWPGHGGAADGARADVEDTDPVAELDRAARDARLGPIGGGTDEIMREILGRQLGL